MAKAGRLSFSSRHVSPYNHAHTGWLSSISRIVSPYNHAHTGWLSFISRIVSPYNHAHTGWLSSISRHVSPYNHAHTGWLSFISRHVSPYNHADTGSFSYSSSIQICLPSHTAIWSEIAAQSLQTETDALTHIYRMFLKESALLWDSVLWCTERSCQLKTFFMVKSFTAAFFGSCVRTHHQADNILKKGCHAQHLVSFCTVYVCGCDLNLQIRDKSKIVFSLFAVFAVYKTAAD